MPSMLTWCHDADDVRPGTTQRPLQLPSCRPVRAHDDRTATTGQHQTAPFTVKEGRSCNRAPVGRHLRSPLQDVCVTLAQAPGVH